jgi:hypothetical protein
MRRLALAVGIALALAAGGCGSRRVVVQTPQVQAPPPRETQLIAAAPSAAGVLGTVVLGQDLFCQFGAVRLQIAANGQFYVDGSFVGTFTPDGGFYNQSGQQIGRLYDNGRMEYAGTMQDAGISGTELISPQGTIAYIDPNGYFHVSAAAIAPAPVIGLTPPTVRTFLFAFSMFAALLDTAQRMGY